VVTAITVTNGGTGYTSPPTVVIGSAKEVTLMTPPASVGIPVGLAPDPANVGPQFIQIGNEGGLQPQPSVLNDPNNVLGQNPNHDPIYVDYQMNRQIPTFGNVLHKNLMMGPAERADISVDFSKCPVGSKLILYNDGPAPIPGYDPRYDIFTSTLDFTTTNNPSAESGC
jgi:hypothetical protein